jgi:RimJ/RimL family protein N-acetyltransferase
MRSSHPWVRLRREHKLLNPPSHVARLGIPVATAVVGLQNDRVDHLQVRVRDLVLTVRDLQAGDVPTIVDYWHESDPGYLASLGVDIAKLASREATGALFSSSLAATPGRPGTRATLVGVTSDGIVAYTNLNFRTEREAVAHVHTLLRDVRTRAAVMMVFPQVVRLYFELFPELDRVVFETSPENRAINRVLQGIGLRPRRMHLERPDGMARVGEFNVYELARDQLPRLADLVGRKREPRPDAPGRTRSVDGDAYEEPCEGRHRLGE